MPENKQRKEIKELKLAVNYLLFKVESLTEQAELFRLIACCDLHWKDQSPFLKDKYPAAQELLKSKIAKLRKLKDEIDEETK